MTNQHSFAQHLQSLPRRRLEDLLARRPDVLVEPAPRNFVQLAQRLCGPGSVAAVLCAVNGDMLSAATAIALLGEQANVETISALLHAAPAEVERVRASLQALGLCWPAGDAILLPEILTLSVLQGVGGGRPIRKILVTASVESVRTAVSAFRDSTGLRKAELVEIVVTRMSDLSAMTAEIQELPGPLLQCIRNIRSGEIDAFYSRVRFGTNSRDVADLIHCGLLIEANHGVELPREVALALWLAETPLRIHGRPQFAPAPTNAESVRPAAAAAATEIVRRVTTLLDSTAATPLAELKKGGVGKREIARLATRMGISAPEVGLCLDLANAAGLLTTTNQGYTPSGTYLGWREAEVGARWAQLARSWWQLDFCPTSRDAVDGQEVSPPVPQSSPAGELRRALLKNAQGGLSLDSVRSHLWWLVPWQPYSPAELDVKVAASLVESELLGLSASDMLTELGEHLLECNAVADLAERACVILVVDSGTVTLQSDLTAVVSGQPSAAAAKLLAAASVSETLGAAQVWRFNQSSVRAALDAGWSAENLLAGLESLSDRAIPQPLEYLINDVARRHGQIKVHEGACCIVAEENLINEMLHTKSLIKLGLAKIAPTVLVAQVESTQAIALLRKAGLFPMPGDATAAVIVRAEQDAAASRAEIAAFALAFKGIGEAPHRPSRSTPESLAAALLGRLGVDEISPMAQVLVNEGSGLNEAELELLAYALENHSEVVIDYRDKNGSYTSRAIRPSGMYGRWIEAFCYLRGGDREFTVGNIESVSPVLPRP
ncbi:hypothetical protein EH165_14570 [Nakamurella antarctica]|uniref:Helicase XPB/Ssl2 N-terminal domain-containing protein n=1 Tax=Nakamurella antarctica TaxID=1902245 RepID=A0A3G8ZPA8_9ACTN|nr:helicase-associated domain-containing protein [Nakamurella antarctica]AZI59182.1 hypothetical protein EH165_14570 [Nakamurella antarctica]